jgi:hypothetical protein
MKFPAKAALVSALVALPVEWVNYRYFAFPIDVGYENPTWFQQVTGAEWVLLHLPGLRLLRWLDRSEHTRWEPLALFGSGYIDTMVLLLLAVLLVHWISGLRGRRVVQPGTGRPVPFGSAAGADSRKAGSRASRTV